MLKEPLEKLQTSEISFNIAGVNFTLSSECTDHINWFRQNYKPFLGSGEDKRDIQITVMTKRKNRRIDRLSFKGCSSLLKLKYSHRLTAEGDLSTGQVMVEVKDGFGLGDFMKSLVSAVLIEKEGFLLHSSGVAQGNRGYVFSGPSGSGKTTIARLSGQRDVLNDETVAFRKRGNRWHAYATPFFGELGTQDKNIWIPLKALFFIHKGNGFSHRKLSRREAIKRIFPNIILRDKRSESVDKLFDIVAEAVESIPCYDFYFKPDNSMWRYIDAVN